MISDSVLQQIRSLLSQIASQGFYESCCLCNRSGSQGFCSDCWRQLLRCQTKSPLPTTAQLPPLLAWGRYQGSLKRAIAQMKYQHQPKIATRLGEELGLKWLQQFPRQDSFVTVPIPLHCDRRSERGYNQAELIARRFSQVVGVTCIPHGLRRIQQTQAQHTLAPEPRVQNLEGAFAVNHNAIKSPHQPVLIIDDIFTTGATMQSAIQTLQQGSITVLGSAVVAQAVYEDAPIFK